ncbi:relaxase/mobilization nuclease domain-containing protein [Blautia coccoides]|uniref:relaxase/mobilization nuclease domain-containing protein n=1 Tax=Blautia producta TaxID=33035 RepID=UPI0028A4D541|nr:relaxase/mobilization nuclease domain-containing protein [Blautia coccoides]MDT4376969.1 relaxase/mobilization nuclease domain-containing protein [Blautia coccoides]
MAVSKLWSVSTNLERVIEYAANPEKTSAKVYSEEQYQALADVLSYAKDEEKTEQEFYVEGINCNPITARDQFITTKELFGKTEGIQAYHAYLSFKEQNITPEMAQRIGMEFAKEVWGKKFQVVVTTHLNTKHLHCHFVINSVSFLDGKRLWGEEKAWFKFRLVADRICEKYGLYYNPNPNRSKQNSYYYKQEQAGMPTRYSMLRSAIDEAIAYSTNLKTFEYNLTQMGYTHCLSESRKYWTVIPKGYSKPVRLKNLGEEYSEEAIKRRLIENQRLKIVPFSRGTVKQYNLPTRGDKIKKKSGIYRLYLYYCYKLGYLPKYKKPDTNKLHYLLREDLLKLDKISEEARLLGRENISTDKQLFSYKESITGEISKLTDDRTHLRKMMRRKISDDELSKVKDEVSTITDKIRLLRKEVKTCESIAERSKVMEYNLSQESKMEQKNKRKEKDTYEQRW